MRKALALALLAILVLAWTLSAWQAPVLENTDAIDLAQALSDDAGTFAKVVPGRAFTFPADHGEHPEFKTEWWYFTGNLSDLAGLSYGYQLTFFRAGLGSPDPGPRSESAWSPKDVIMAHFAVSDPARGQFFPFERFARRALGLAGVKSGPGGLSVWLEDWRMERGVDGTWTLLAAETLPDGAPLALSLRLSEMKPPVLQGQEGYSRKGPKPEHSSYYVSLTRLATAGKLTLGNRQLEVSGASWFDHEWSSSALAPGLVGWDWFSLQLEDGSEVMLYLLRYQDGRLDPASSGALIAADSGKTSLDIEDFKVEIGSHHTSPRGVSYPSSWTVRLPQQSMVLRLTPRMADQEMASGVAYWEGAVTVEGEREGHPVAGSGFVEMTGYK